MRPSRREDAIHPRVDYSLGIVMIFFVLAAILAMIRRRPTWAILAVLAVDRQATSFMNSIPAEVACALAPRIGLATAKSLTRSVDACSCT